MIGGATTVFGIEGALAKLVLIAIVAAATLLSFMLLRWVVPRIASRVQPGADATKRRQRQTAAALLSTMLRYVVLVAAVVAIVVILADGGGAGALGGTAVLAIVLGFASQRLLTDVIAGFFILFEGQYAVGDVIALEPSGFTGVVEEIGVRTTILRSPTGERTYVPNGQITAVRRFPSARTMLSVTLLTRDPDAAQSALEHVGDLTARGAGIAASAQDITRRELGGGVVAVHGRLGVAATLAEPARELVGAVLQARLADTLSAPPVVATVEPRDAERPEGVVE